MNKQKNKRETGETMKRQLGIYLHIPFCVRKCRYCDFLSFPADADIRERYVQRLILEIRSFAQHSAEIFRDTGNESDLPDSADSTKPGRPEWVVPSIFIGGGTPSVLSADQIRRILDAVRSSFTVEEDAEVTMECNPGTDTDFGALLDAGINRISLGIQSDDNRMLALLGRIHTWEEAVMTVDKVRRAGFTNLNTDLIFSLPGQTLQQWRQTLQRTVSVLNPEHISAYSLIIEEGTPFYDLYHAEDERRAQGGAVCLLPDEDTEREMYWETERFLDKMGYERYEISNYARRGYRSVHNTGYWTRREYAGFGIGAASQIGSFRYKNTDDLETYLNKGEQRIPAVRGEKLFFPVLEEKILLSAEDARSEAMFLGLRMKEGVNLEYFAARYGESAQKVWPGLLQKLEAQGLLCHEKNRIRLTDRGTDLSNYVFSMFLQ